MSALIFLLSGQPFRQILAGLDGVLVLIDDILVFGMDQEEHDARLEAVLQRLKTVNVTLIVGAKS